MSEKTETKNMPVRIPKGNEAIFVLAISVDGEGRASVSYNFQNNVNLAKIAMALEDFAKNLAHGNAEA